MVWDLAVLEIEFPADIIRVDGKEHSKLWADGGQAHARERRAVRLEIEGVRRGSDLEERGIGQRATEFVNLAGDSEELEPEGFVLDVANRGVVGFVVHNENALLGELRISRKERLRKAVEVVGLLFDDEDELLPKFVLGEA